MSSSQVEQFSTEYASLVTGNYYTFAGTAFLVYDTLLTAGEEIRCFWGRKLTGAALLFWLNRYLTIMYYATQLWTDPNISQKDCTTFVRVQLSLELFLSFMAALFTAIRIYALRKNRVLSFAIFLLAIVPIGINLAQYAFGLSGEVIPILGCQPDEHIPLNLAKRLAIVSRTSLIMTDSAAVAATWVTFKPRYGDIRYSYSDKITLSRVLLVDGTIYFLTLAVLNSLHLIFTMLSLEEPALQDASYFSQFTAPFTTVIISRFLLRLQSANLRATDMASSQDFLPSQGGSIVFERVIGSLGTPLSSDDYFLDEDGGVNQEGRYEGSRALPGPSIEEP